MRIKKEMVAALVADVSKSMSDPDFSAGLVGAFVQVQTPVAQFLTAHESELGGAEAVINVVFHAALVSQCFARAGGKPRTLSFEDLDQAAMGEPLAELGKAQPSLAELIISNVEHEEARRLLALIALAMDRTA